MFFELERAIVLEVGFALFGETKHTYPRRSETTRRLRFASRVRGLGMGMLKRAIDLQLFRFGRKL